MSLTRPRRLTPASLAARRANALKSTGPRTVRGKARVGFNALKLGVKAARSARLRDRLIQAGYDREEALYGRIRSRIAQTFGTSTSEERSWCDRLATKVWCLAIRSQARWRISQTKLKESRKQRAWILRTSSHQQIEQEGKPDNREGKSDNRPVGSAPGFERLNFGIRDPWRRIGLRFWVQRKRYWTLARMRRLLSTAEAAAEGAIDPAEAAPAVEGEKQAAPPSGGAFAPDTLHSQEWPCHRGPNEGLERAVRSRAFRVAKPGAIERYRYSLMPNGDPDWEREPWKNALALRRAAEAKKGSRGGVRESASASKRPEGTAHGELDTHLKGQ